MKNIKKIFSLLIIVSVILSSFSIVSAAATNLALGATILSSGAGASYKANVNDGVKNTNNSNSANITSIDGSKYIGFDLGNEKNIEKVIIYESTSATKHIGDFVIETADNSSFTGATQVASGTGLTTSGKTVTFPSPVTARYIRFRPISYLDATSGQVYISEIEVIEAAAITPPPPPTPPTPPTPSNTPDNELNLAGTATFTAGGGASSSNIGRLKDGTKYISANSSAYNFGSTAERFIVCNLGSLKYINTVEIYEYAKSLKLEGYELLYSQDGSTYISLAKVDGAGTNGGLAIHQFETVSAQYLKLVLKSASGTVYLAEFEVYYKDNVVLPTGTKNLINAQSVASATSSLTYDGNKASSYKNTLPSNTLNAEITLNNAEPIKALIIYFENGENIGNISVNAGASSGSNSLVYTDTLGSNVKIIPITDATTKYIKVALSGISGVAGIAEIEGLSDDNAMTDYIYNVKEIVSDYVINQAKYSNTVTLPSINSSTWSVSNPSVANIAGATLNITGTDTTFYLTGNLDLGGTYSTTVDISVTVGSNLNVVPVVPEINDTVLIAGADINLFKDIDNSWAYDYIVNLNKLKIISGVTKTTFEPERQITRAEFVKLLVESLMIHDNSAKSSYKDVKATDWYYSYIGSLEKLGATGNVWGDNFCPEANITREDMAYFTANALKAKNISLNLSYSSSLSDFNSISEYARESVTLLTQTGFVVGNPDGTFNPKDNLTRAEASKIIYLVYNCY